MGLLADHDEARLDRTVAEVHTSVDGVSQPIMIMQDLDAGLTARGGLPVRGTVPRTPPRAGGVRAGRVRGRRCEDPVRHDGVWPMPADPHLDDYPPETRSGMVSVRFAGAFDEARRSALELRLAGAVGGS